MAYRRALAVGLRSLARQASQFGGVTSVVPSAVAADTTAIRASNSALLQMARGFAAEPAAAAPAASMGKVTQVRRHQPFRQCADDACFQG